MTEPTANPSTGSRGLLLLAGFVVVVAGMKAASTIVVPILAAVFVAVVSLPPTAALVRLGVRRWLATLTVFFVVMLLGLGTAAIVASTATSFAGELPTYQEMLQVKIYEGVDWLQEKGVNITRQQVDDVLDPGLLFPFLQRTLTSFVGLLQDTVFVLLTVIFILMELTAIPSKVRAIAPPGNGDETLDRWRHVLGDLSGYLVVKTATSAVTGLLAGLGCWFFGLPYALVLGLIAFVLNYVPSLGSIIASVPAIIVALVLQGFGTAAGVAILYLVINVSIGSLTEPRIMGRRMGLSPLIVFLSLVFWGFILGPVGMFLSVPLTMIVKILLEGTEDLRWVAIILGPGEPEAPKTRAATTAAKS
jgi:AI-2 transport protein TqsA